LVFMRQKQYGDAQQMLQVAIDLFTSQSNPQWADSARQLLEQAQNPGS